MLSATLPTLCLLAQNAAYRAGQVFGVILILAIAGAIVWNFLKKN